MTLWKLSNNDFDFYWRCTENRLCWVEWLRDRETSQWWQNAKRIGIPFTGLLYAKCGETADLSLVYEMSRSPLVPCRAAEYDSWNWSLMSTESVCIAMVGGGYPPTLTQDSVTATPSVKLSTLAELSTTRSSEDVALFAIWKKTRWTESVMLHITPLIIIHEGLHYCLHGIATTYATTIYRLS